VMGADAEGAAERTEAAEVLGSAHSGGGSGMKVPAGSADTGGGTAGGRLCPQGIISRMRPMVARYGRGAGFARHTDNHCHRGSGPHWCAFRGRA